MATWAFLSKNSSSPNEFCCIVIMLRHTCGNSQNIDIEDNVLWVKLYLINQNFVSSLANSDFVIACGSLSLLVESHDNNGCTILLDSFSVASELIFSSLKRNTIDNAFPLAILKSGFNDLKLTRINHNRHLGNIRVRQRHPHKPRHRFLPINQPIIKIKIQNLCSIFHLILSHGNSCFILILLNQLFELEGPRYIAPLAHVNELYMIPKLELLHTRKHHLVALWGLGPSGDVLDGVP